MSKKETKADTIEVKAPVVKQENKPEPAKWGTVEWADSHPYFSDVTSRKQRARILAACSDKTKNRVALCDQIYTVLDNVRKFGYHKVPDATTALEQYGSTMYQLLEVILEQACTIANTFVRNELIDTFMAAKVAKAEKTTKAEKKPAKK